MSKYEPLWKWIRDNGRDGITLSFAEIEKISGFALDHTFLTYKKELDVFGFRVGRISMKGREATFERIMEGER